MIPIRTDRPLRRTPYVNYGLVAVNVLVFLMQLAGTRQGSGGRTVMPDWANALMLHPVDPAWYQFITYQFLHGGWMHIIFNMVFLYVFGNCVEDRLRHSGYLLFYLVGGVIAGVGHMLLENNPVLGASGSVAAVTGAFLVLFPYTRVTILWLFILITWFEIPSIYIILIYFAKDLLGFLGGGGGVAYLAHLSGTLFGVAVSVVLLATGLLKREPYDLVTLAQHWNRRRRFRSVSRRGESPWQGDAHQRQRAEAAEPEPASEEEREIMRLRSEVSRALAQQQGQSAVDAYERLLKLDGDQVLHQQGQLNLGNYAMHLGHHQTAARAYELFLKQYPYNESVQEVHLMLGLLYSRYLSDSEQARPHLSAAAERLDDPQRRQLAEQMLAEIGA